MFQRMEYIYAIIFISIKIACHSFFLNTLYTLIMILIKLRTMIQFKFDHPFKTNTFGNFAVKYSSYLTTTGIYLYRNEHDGCGRYISHRSKKCRCYTFSSTSCRWNGLKFDSKHGSECTRYDGEARDCSYTVRRQRRM